MHDSICAQPEAVEPLARQRDWLASRDALQLVMAVYASHDFVEYPSNEKQQTAAMAVATDAIMRRLTEGWLLAKPQSFQFTQGNQDKTQDLVIPLREPGGTIDPSFWRTLHRLNATATLDWIAGDFSFIDSDAGVFAKGYASGVMLDSACLPALGENAILCVSTIGKAKPKAGGRPRKWDWDRALIHLAVKAHLDPDGLMREDGGQPNQSDIGRHLRAWFLNAKLGEPESSQLRERGELFETELNAMRLQPAKNLRSTE